MHGYVVVRTLKAYSSSLIITHQLLDAFMKYEVTKSVWKL